MDQSTANLTTTIEQKIYTGVAARILKLLCSGTTQEQAARQIGVNPSYVTQLCNEPEFQLQIAAQLQVDAEQAIEIDNNYAETEKLLSKKLKDLAPFINSPDSILKMLRFVNDAKMKTQKFQNNGANNSETGTGVVAVQLILPVVVKNTFVVNPNNEVVGVDNRELVTLDAKKLETIIAEKKAKPVALPAPKNARLENSDPWSSL